MTERQKLFRRVFQSMVEGRSQAAQRYIAEYLKTHQPRVGRFTSR